MLSKHDAFQSSVEFIGRCFAEPTLKSNNNLEDTELQWIHFKKGDSNRGSVAAAFELFTVSSTINLGLFFYQHAHFHTKAGKCLNLPHFVFPLKIKFMMVAAVAFE